MPYLSTVFSGSTFAYQDEGIENDYNSVDLSQDEESEVGVDGMFFYIEIFI